MRLTTKTNGQKVLVISKKDLGLILAEYGKCPNCDVKTVKHKNPDKAGKGQRMCPKCKADFPQTPYAGSWADEEKKRKNKNTSQKKAQVIPNDGIADGGEPYTDEEMDLMNKEQNSISIPASTLQNWALSLSQGNMAPRWEIEKLLEAHGHHIRSNG